jgi:enterobactin synthetase component D / holo-[acyl-carrier protein] synthase
MRSGAVEPYPGGRSPIEAAKSKIRADGRGLQLVTGRTGMTPLGHPLDSEEGFALVILSAKDQSNCRLHFEETLLLNSNVSPKRRAEFTLGRAAAQLALKQIGFDNPPPVLQGRSFEPLWPEGIVGSITHCHPWTIVIAAKRSVALTVGIDLESIQRMGREDISSLICVDSELDWAHDDGDFLVRLTMIFSAKETIFKAFYPVCQRFIDFKEVKLSWIAGRKSFMGEFLIDLSPGLQRGCWCEVRCQRGGDFILTYLAPEPLSDKLAAHIDARLVE